jgi:hypothetical protein
MSTTNPIAGAGGTPGADDHGRSGPPAPEVIKRGYEADGYDAKSVIGVPILVILFFVLAFGTVTILFRFLKESPSDPAAHPMASERNAADLNARMDRIHLGADVSKGGVDQPRLEPLRLRSGDARAITRPELPLGNSPELHPEDLIPSRERTPGLYQNKWIEDGKVAKVPLDEAMKAALSADSKLFATQKAGTAPARSTNVPSAANAGRGFGDSVATPPGAKPAGKVEPKKEEGKH